MGGNACYFPAMFLLNYIQYIIEFRRTVPQRLEEVTLPLELFQCVTERLA